MAAFREPQTVPLNWPYVLTVSTYNNSHSNRTRHESKDHIRIHNIFFPNNRGDIPQNGPLELAICAISLQIHQFTPKFATSSIAPMCKKLALWGNWSLCFISTWYRYQVPGQFTFVVYQVMYQGQTIMRKSLVKSLGFHQPKTHM